MYTLSSTGQKRAEQFIRKVQHVNGLHILGPGYNNRVPIVSIQTDFMDEADLVKALEEAFGVSAMVAAAPAAGGAAAEAAPAEPEISSTDKLLIEIRDLLKKDEK